MERGDTPNSGPPVAASVMAAAAMGESQCEATRQKRMKKKPKPDGAGFGVAPSQSPLPAATFLQTHTQSPAPGTPILEEAVAVRKRKVRNDQKAAAEGDKHGKEPMLAATTTMKKKKKHRERRSSPSLSAAAAAKEPILQQGPEVNTEQKRNNEEGPSTAQLLQDPAQSPALGAQILEEATTEAAMRKWKMRDEKRVAVLPFAQNQEQTEERVLAVTTKKKKRKRRESKSSPSLTAAATVEAPILQQEAKVTKKRLPLDPTQAQSQGTKPPRASKPLSAATFLEAQTQPLASRTPMLEEAAVAVMSERKICKEQKVVALPLSQNTTLEEPVLAMTMMKKKHKERKSSPSLTVPTIAEAPILQQEAKMTKKRLPHDPTHAQSQGTKASHAAKPLSAATFLEAPTQPPASRTPMLEEAAVAVMSEGKICKDQKVAALPLSENTTLEEPVLAATMMKKKKHKGHKSSPSLTDAAAAEAPILQQEAKVTKKPKRRKEEGPSTYSPLQLHPGLTQSEGTKVSHASKPLPAATFFEDPAQYTAPRAPMLEKAAAVMSKRKICKEQRVAAVCLAQNTTLEEQRDDTMAVKEKKESNHMKHTLSSISASAASETTIWEHKVKVTKKQKQRKQQEPSGKSPLSLHPGQTHSAQSQGGKAPPEQEGEADARKGSSIKKSNGKMPCVRVLSNRKLIKEASKRQPALPEGFVPFSDFVSNCTEQNPDESLPYRAFFDQFRYNPVRGDHKPPLPRTPDHLARLLPRANETSKASKTNNSVVCKSKKKDSGPGSQEKLHPQVKENPKKMGTTKRRQPPPLLTPAEMCSDIYRRVPLDQLVPPPRSPHNLLQEKYASDPWKVIVICMLLNLTQGKQVKNIIEGFFECYPDAHSAINADPEKMAGYLECLGLQHVKTTRIQKFSKEYVEKEWTYITELCGVGKYAADAYAIFCAGRAIEVAPKDHKLVDYWKYVCFKLPLMQKAQNAQEAGVQEQELAVMS
ncbi:uncharacterized protein [Lolium perenne]|uniref:uncharacterized protein n=1 Tax=Lolium perenne TaxID=4522 RepID=UPI0021F5B86A|nr:uncharacterized protein LOC127342176 isoform X1 [Lolium perenne]